MEQENGPERNPIVIFGSSRSNGNTYEAITSVVKDRTVPIIDLNKIKLSYYDYDYVNSQDDFIPIAERMITHNPIILATPVYWYSMSGLMKTFIDRWTDLIDMRKDILNGLAGKELFVVTSYATDIPKGFEDPFFQTCKYLNMQYKGCLYFYSGNDLKRKEKNHIPVERLTNRIFSVRAQPEQQSYSHR